MLSGAELLGDNNKIQALTFRSKSCCCNHSNTHTLATLVAAFIALYRRWPSG